MIIRETTTPSIDVGNYLVSLLDDRSWLKRRVDTVSFVDEDSSVRQCTFDIDTAAISSLQPAGFVREGYVAVPLMLLEKQLLIDSDLRDESGRALHIASRQDDSFLTWCLTAAYAERQKLSIQRQPLVASALRRIVESFPQGPRQDLRQIAPEWRLDPVPEWEATDTVLWRNLFSNLSLRSWIHDVTYGFLLVTYLPVESNISIVKFTSRVDIDTSEEGIIKRVASRMGFLPSRVVIPIPGSTEAERRHLRIKAPDGLEWSKVSVDRLVTSLRVRKGRSLTQEPEAVCQVTLTRDRVHIYISSQEPWRRLRANLGLHVPTAGFQRAACFSALLNAAVLGAGIRYHQGLVDMAGGNVDAAVALLLLAPTIFSAYLVRSGEHALLGRLLRWSRYVLVVSMGTVYMASIDLAVYLEQQPDHEETLWRRSFEVAVGAAVVLLFSLASSALQAARLRRMGIRRRFAKRDGRTMSLPIEEKYSTATAIDLPPAPAP